MTLIATVAATGVEVESFSTPSDLWGQWRKLPMGTFVIGRDCTPAVLKRSVRGLQFFAAAPGMAGVTAPESIEHQIAKIKLALGMRAAGHQARVEQPGTTPSGEQWHADVLVQTARGPLAVEVQLAQQHWDEYRSRTARYRASGVSVVWLVRSSHIGALANSKRRHHVEQGLEPEAAKNQAMDDMPCIPIEVPVGDESGQRVIVYPADRSEPFLRLPLANFGAGIASGALHMGEHRYLDGSQSWQDWMWDTSKVPRILLPPNLS